MAFSLTRFLIKHPAGKLTNNSHSHLPAVVLFLYISFCNQYSITEVSFHVSQNGLATKWMNKYKEKILMIQCKNSHIKSIIRMARKTAANPDAYYSDLRVRLSVGCKRWFYFFFKKSAKFSSV